jgi:ketosteroid isomerase-like protein
MKAYCIFILLLFFIACSPEKVDDDTNLRQSTEQQLRDLSQQLHEAEISDDLSAYLKHYDEHAISMPEYQLTLKGVDEIRMYYNEIFKRQNIQSFQCVADEFIHMNNTIVEIGTFKKEYRNDSNTDSLITLNGKYWHIWEAQGGVFKLYGEAFGYFNPVAHPEALIVELKTEQPNESDILSQKEIPFELRAYNALMEKGVRTRDGILRSSFFTDDARVFPFADSTVSGIENIKPYLIAYSSRGTVTIDSIMCYTYDFKYSDNYLLEYDMFKVKWRVPDFSGKTEGKGIRIWKRQDDNSLKLYREIGTHNHLP